MTNLYSNEKMRNACCIETRCGFVKAISQSILLSTEFIAPMDTRTNMRHPIAAAAWTIYIGKLYINYNPDVRGE
jgi:hypothetical protein